MQNTGNILSSKRTEIFYVSDFSFKIVGEVLFGEKNTDFGITELVLEPKSDFQSII